MTELRAFSPGTTVSITVANTTANVKVAEQVNKPVTVRVTNAGSATVWVKGGNSSVTAAVTDFPVLATSSVNVVLNPASDGKLYIAAIAAGSTGVIYFTPGNGGV